MESAKRAHHHQHFCLFEKQTPIDISSMELVRGRGQVPHFPFEEFRKKQQEYDDSGVRHEWENLEELQMVAVALLQGEEFPAARIVGHFSRSAASKLLGWEFGELYAVAYVGSVLACLPGGFVVA